ncbi:hypothetical protein SUDANB21_05359 [Streptomyces sp. enrichment culture]|uniref:hypothetical protein n=1 Tax=unclassified Streptomyces TaxID=2593676 RepID=UPI0029B3AD22|nr:hypothetical protein [Streptomyces sp. MD20-1-1]WTC15912.1 hypothetical protein OH709_08440 [Streptomyces cellulosae]
MTEMARLEVLFEEIGRYQRALDNGMALSTGGPEIYRRVLEVQLLLPPGNEHIWSGFRMWIMRSWATALERGGDAEAEPWRVFLVEIGDLLGPAPD